MLLARVLNADAVQFAAFTLGVMALHGLRAVYSALAIYISQRRRLPVVTRNVDLSELRIPDPPPAPAHGEPLVEDALPRRARSDGRPGRGPRGRLHVVAGRDVARGRGGNRCLRGHRTVRAQEQAPRRQGPRPARGERPDTRVRPAGRAVFQRRTRRGLPGEHVAGHPGPAGPADDDHHAGTLARSTARADRPARGMHRRDGRPDELLPAQRAGGAVPRQYRQEHPHDAQP